MLVNILEIEPAGADGVVPCPEWEVYLLVILVVVLYWAVTVDACCVAWVLGGQSDYDY